MRKTVRFILPWLCLLVVLSTSAVLDAQTPRTPMKDATPADTLDPLVVTTGGATGTYARFFNETLRVCSQPPLSEWKNKEGQPSDGSRTNIDNLLGNTANIGFVQTDALFARKTIDNDPEVERIKVLLTLYPEEVHILTRSATIHRFSDLGNKKVRAWGGSHLTGLVLFYKTGIRPAQFFPVPNAAAAVTQVDKGDADAIISVGGQPLDWVLNLPSQGWKIIPFDMVDRVRDVYDVATVQYKNLSPTGVKTVTTQSLLVTMDYRSKPKVAALTALRRCILENLDTLRETTGNHPKWRLVSEKNESVWPVYAPVVAPKPAPSPNRGR
jgi:TRAP-type uncharacterized transport system substrate-binding protein